MDIYFLNNLILFFGLMILAVEDHESGLISNNKLLLLVVYKLISDFLFILYLHFVEKSPAELHIKDLYSRLLLAIIVTLILFLFALVFSEAMGMGDVKLIGTLVLYLGSGVLFLMLLSFIVLFIWAACLKLMKHRVDKLPLAPSIFIAYMIFILLKYV